MSEIHKKKMIIKNARSVGTDATLFIALTSSPFLAQQALFFLALITFTAPGFMILITVNPGINVSITVTPGFIVSITVTPGFIV
jgi:hypothetical protein